MKQVAINGLFPGQEPAASELAAVSTYARARGVTTVYDETQVSPAIALTVAHAAGPSWQRWTRSRADQQVGRQELL